jgi:hypothetical protein
MALILRWVLLSVVAATGLAQAQDVTPEPPLEPVKSSPAIRDSSEVEQSTPREEGSSDIGSRLDAIDAVVAKLADETSKVDYTPALLAFSASLIGVIVGALVALLTQRKLLAHQERLSDVGAKNAKELAADRAKLEIGNSIVQWQLKQLSELYGPLHALFRQSHALYRHMNTVLVKMEPDRFRFREEPRTERFDEQAFEINLEGEWVRFRTVLHMQEAYGRGYGVDDYFDGIVAIGARIVRVIEEKAGYVRPEQAELVSLFGKYLAHYSVLERLNAHSKKERGLRESGGIASQIGDTIRPIMRADASAVFPAEIQGFVDSGFRAISDELDAWRIKASA